jgi:plastocyanin domain-containing protein
MDNTEFFVLAAGLLLIAAVLWYFFGKREGAVAETRESGVQEINVTVKGGYDPDLIVVKPGKSVRLNFYRDENSSCSEQLVFSDFGVVRDLPAYKTTTIEFTPDKPGEYLFACGMGMLRGKVVVKALE